MIFLIWFYSKVRNFLRKCFRSTALASLLIIAIIAIIYWLEHFLQYFLVIFKSLQLIAIKNCTSLLRIPVPAEACPSTTYSESIPVFSNLLAGSPERMNTKKFLYAFKLKVRKRFSCYRSSKLKHYADSFVGA